MVEVNTKAVLDRVSVRMVRVFNRRYVQLVKELSRSLSYNINPEFSVISLYILYKLVESVIADLNSDIKEQVSSELELAYYIGFAVSLMAYYDSVGISYTYKSVMLEVPTLIDRTVLVKMKNVTMNDLLQVTQNTEYAVKQYIRETMTKHLNVKNMRNTGRVDLANVLVRELQGKKLKQGIEKNMIAIVDKAGRRWNLHTYVDVVVQTKAHEVYVQGLKDFANQHNGEGDLVKIPHNPLTEDACLNFEGMVISMTGATAGYRTYDELKATGLIFHPRCRHHPRPYNKLFDN